VPEDATLGVEPVRPTSGEHERHLAIGTVAQQVSQAVGLLTMLASITVLARELTLSEFGTYGLLLSLSTYLLFIQGNIEIAAVKAVAEATDQTARDRAFSTALSLYVVSGLAAGAVLAGGGSAVLGLFNIPPGLHHEAQISVLALAVVTCIGWPLKIFQDVLRGSQSFVLSAMAEIVAFLFAGLALIALAVNGAALWLLVAAGASTPALMGAVAAGVFRWKRLPYRYSLGDVTPSGVRKFLSLSLYLGVGGISGLVIYSTDRAILAAFRSAATVGLYEGPVRAHNLVQQVHGTLVIPVLPASARYLAEGDDVRTRELLVRGTRYLVATIVPLAIVLMVLAQPILEVWLGSKFRVAATAMTLLVSYWLLNSATGVAGTMLVAAGRVRPLAIYAAAVAGLNLVLSLLLTPILGLNGVVLGTTISYLLGFPFFMRLTLKAFPVSLADFWHEAWLPAYVTGAVMAGLLLAVRLSVPLNTVPRVVGTGLAALLAYWIVYYAVWLRPSERVLVRDVALAVVRR
jgi:O-antigen/teichoic acid export membrane protein